MLAGKNRSNVLAAILQSPEVLKKAYETSLNAEGAAQKELETYLDSIEGRISQTKASFQALSNDIISSEIIKGVISLGDGILRLTDFLINANTEIEEFIVKAGRFVPMFSSFYTVFDETVLENQKKYFENLKALPTIIGAATAAWSVYKKDSGINMPSVRVIERMHKLENCWKPLTPSDQSAA